jgi:hypothetical protein
MKMWVQRASATVRLLRLLQDPLVGLHLLVTAGRSVSVPKITGPPPDHVHLQSFIRQRVVVLFG